MHSSPTIEPTARARAARYLFFTAGIAMAVLAVSGVRPPVSYDAFWHLAMGRDFVVHGWLPWIDHHSFTYTGTEIVSPPYPFQVLLHALVELGGLENGFTLYKLISYAALVLATLLWFRRIDAPISLIILCFTCIVLLAQLRTSVRPELLSYAFCIVTLILAERAGDQYTTRTMLPLFVLMVVWSNYHSAVFGYVLLFGMFVDSAVAMWRARARRIEWIGWAGWGTLIVLAGFINPSFTHTIITLLAFADEWKTLIQEYEPPLLYAGIAGLYVCLAMAIFAVALGVAARRPGLLFVCVLLLSNALDTARLVAPAGILIMALIPLLWRESHRPANTPIVPQRSRLAIPALALLTAIPLGSALHLAYTYANEHAAAARLYPSAIVNYMRANDIGGRIFNAYEVGGYLAYHLSPDAQVFIDGRTGILYPLEHHYTFTEAERSSAAFAKMVDDYSVNAALVHNTLAQHSVVVRSSRMQLDFVGIRYALYKRAPGNFPVLGHLQIHPACWRSADIDPLNAERTLAQRLLPAESPILPFANLIADYGNAPNRVKFLQQLGTGAGLSDTQRRFAGYRAMAQKQFRTAYALFGGIQLREPRDPLAAAVALLGLNAPDLASEALAVAAKTKWPHLTPHDLQLMQALLKRIDPKANGIPEAFVTQVDTALAQIGSTHLKGELSAASFCRR